MKLLALALILMVASSSFAAVKTSNEHDGYLHGRELGEEGGGRPRRDFSKGGSDNDNGGG
ncbi:hypothetical protein Pyn_01279 [Prunus yedoensis var. nudiflora]|uniref:Uncharacterized protein n=1 Tax=Prunus yedoensis var. nudiflora TaxID=2094558 RepID=A0A314ZPN6_PRUYE|nr:hypothetical protein Pyn_01279 [Prunus yedoensis var. nudiflora]